MRMHLERMETKEEAHPERMEAFLGLRPWGEVTGACPEKSKAAVVTFKDGSDIIEAKDLEANPGSTEAIVERQELYTEEANIDNIGSSEGQYDDLRLAIGHCQ
jgi:hypothetical protein